LDNYVLDQLYLNLFSDGAVKRLVGMLSEYANKKAATSNDELILTEKELANVKQKISKVIQLVSESGISIETVKVELKKLEERKNFIEGRIQSISMENKTFTITEDTIVELIERSKNFVRTKNIPECRNFIDSYVEKVIVYGDKVEVFFKIQVPDDTEGIAPLSTGERIGLIQQEYKTPSLYQ
jgi:site-specific DNA recombinase